MPMRLMPEWNCIVLDLATLCLRLFGTQLHHTIRVRVFANCRLRRVYFHDKILQEHELPVALRVFPDISMPIADQQVHKTEAQLIIT
jgi:hypothetical protein